MNKTLALLLDSYRELNAKRMFWVALIISAVVMGALACIGIKDEALTLFWWKTPIQGRFLWGITPAGLYKWMFLKIGVSYWLTWAGTILALASTASIYPDFMASGSIDLYLSKPISRLRLFATKYVGGLLFVAMQVLVFALAGFLVLGIRGKTWEPRIFWSIPLVLAVFSYLFSVCVLLGVISRSTIASLIWTLVIWLFIAGIYFAEVITLQVQIAVDARGFVLDKQIARVQYQLDHYTTSGPASAPVDVQASSLDQFKAGFRQKMPFHMLGDSRSDLRAQIEQMRAERAQISTSSIHTIHNVFYSTLTMLPKTQGATDLLRQQLRMDEPDTSSDEDPPDFSDSGQGGRRNSDQREYLKTQTQKEMARRTPAWILGTSFAFEGVMLGLAAWFFCRRDY